MRGPAPPGSMPADQSPHLSATRAPIARGPEPGEALRAAYLDLLKLCLCDLTGTGTTSVIWNAVDPVHSRELAGEDLKKRVVGQDWPLHGLTMVGLDRLDDLQSLVEDVIADDIPGDLIEAGSWRGGAAILMRATLDAHGEDDRTVWVCDSFEGFPAPDREAFPTEDRKLDPLGDIDFLSVPQEEVRANFSRFGLERGVKLVPGFFESTLPRLGGGPWAIVRLDGDTYEATWLALESLYPQLSVGGYLVVDDYQFIAACRRAVDDFRVEHGITEPLENIDWNGVRWRRETEQRFPEPAERPNDRGADPPPSAAGRKDPQPIPSLRELELNRELEDAQKRLAGVEAELTRLRGSPLAGPRAWARQRLRGPRSG
jgi:O-methyltransferase